MSSKSIEQELETTKSKVRKALREKEKARNSDKYLIWYIQRNLEKIDRNDPDEVKDATSPTTIITTRQEIQNQQGKYLPTKAQVIKRRKIREEKIREYYGEMSKVYQNLENE
jgi:hypothetical protein